MENIEFWFVLTYAVGTAVGWFFAYKSKTERVLTDFLTDLIEAGYIKTKGTGDNKEIVKYWENDNK